MDKNFALNGSALQKNAGVNLWAKTNTSREKSACQLYELVKREGRPRSKRTPKNLPWPYTTKI